MNKLYIPLLPALVIGLAAEAGPSRMSYHMPCNDRATTIAELAQTHGESPRVIAMDTRGLMFEFFLNESTKTWTATLVDPSGLMCILGYGSGFEFITQVLNAPEL